MSDLYSDSHRSASRWVKRLRHTIIQTTAAISSGTVCGGWVRRRGRLVIFGDQSMSLLFGRENHRTWIPLPHEQGSGHLAIGSAASAWSTLIGHATAHTTPEDESPARWLRFARFVRFNYVQISTQLFVPVPASKSPRHRSSRFMFASHMLRNDLSHTHDNITSCLKTPLARITWSCRQLPSAFSS